MNIVVTSTGPSLESEICPRFGRADYFIIVNPESLEFKAVGNPNKKAVGGAGIQSSQIIINHDAQAVLSGRVGMNAFRVLESAGIAVYENIEGTVMDAVKIFNEKKIIPSKTARPGLNRHQNRFRGGDEPESKNDKQEIDELKEELSKLNKQIIEVNEKLNRLQK